MQSLSRSEIRVVVHAKVVHAKVLVCEGSSLNNLHQVSGSTEPNLLMFVASCSKFEAQRIPGLCSLLDVIVSPILSSMDPVL